MFHVDNNSAVPVMPAVKPVVSAVTSFFTEGGNGVPPTYPGPDWFNIIQSELLAILAAAGISPDKASNVQLLAAMRVLFLDASQNGADIQDKAAFLQNLGLVDSSGYGGRLLAPPIEYQSSQALTMPSTGNLFRLRLLGGGGGSGSVGATSSSSLAASGGGGSGSYAELWLTRAQLQALFTASGGTIQLTIGAGGSAGVGNGGNGGATSFGSYIICPGGLGSAYATPVTAPINKLFSGGGPGAVASVAIAGLPSSQVILLTTGAAGSYGLVMTSGDTLSGAGASSQLGSGGNASGASSAPNVGYRYGIGAGGATNAPSQAAKNGAAGNQGIFIMEIYA